MMSLLLQMSSLADWYWGSHAAPSALNAAVKSEEERGGREKQARLNFSVKISMN